MAGVNTKNKPRVRRGSYLSRSMNNLWSFVDDRKLYFSRVSQHPYSFVVFWIGIFKVGKRKSTTDFRSPGSNNLHFH